jgi:hypothetical protein
MQSVRVDFHHILKMMSTPIKFCVLSERESGERADATPISWVYCGTSTEIVKFKMFNPTGGRFLRFDDEWKFYETTQ